MFTIKQVTRGEDRKTDRVRLWQGRNPAYEPSPDSTGKMQVTFQMDDGCHCSIDSGAVFIMNEAGRTVDTYRLEGSDWF